MNHTPNINYTVRHSLCTGCGVCEGACPRSAIHMQIKNGCFRPVVDKDLCVNNKGCHRCYDSCPGISVDLARIAQDNFLGSKIDKYAGHYLKCFTGYSTNYDIRYHCASGGMVSQFLIFLLEKKYIDGAFVTAFDAHSPLKVISYLATDKEQVLAAKSSKYAPVSLNKAIREIKNAPGKRYVIVGVPCHIEGFRKYEKIDRKFQEKVAFYFSIYCSSGRSFYLTEHVFKERKINMDNLISLSYRDNGCLGNMVASYEKNGSIQKHEEPYQSYYHPLRSFFVPKRCTMCIDHYGELADISFGDIHIKPYIADKIGVNSLIVRNVQCLDLLFEAAKEKYITLDEISVDVLNSSQKMAYIKKSRNVAFLRLNHILGKKTPHYDIQYKESISFKWILSYIHTNLQHFIGFHKWMWFVIPFIKGKVPNE